MTVVMKIDLAGPARRGLALGLNEAAGYLGVAATAFATGALAATYAPRTVIWVGAALIAAAGLVISAGLGARHRTPTSRSSSATTTQPRIAHAADRLRARHLARPGAAGVQPGRSREQSQRRARLGPGAAVPGGKRRQRAPDRDRRGRVSSGVGCRSALHRLAQRPHRTETADHHRHARPRPPRWDCWSPAAAPSRHRWSRPCCSAQVRPWSIRR